MSEAGTRRSRYKDNPFYATKVGRIAFTVGAEAVFAANTIDVAVQCYNQDGLRAIGESVCLSWYLSSDATGRIPLGTAPTGGTVVGAAGGLIEDLAELSGKLITNSAGICNVRITDSGTITCYLCVVLPDGSIAISGAVTFA